MSRIGKRPITIPTKVTVEINGNHVAVKGPKGQLARSLPDMVDIHHEGDTINVIRHNESRKSRERHGLSRTLIANMIEGVFSGFQKHLIIQGVGYRAQMQGKTLVLNVGYSHPVEIEPPEGVEFEVIEKNTQVLVRGINKEIVGNITAKIRAVRPPEVYKGKGIRYKDEVVRRKAGKSGKK